MEKAVGELAGKLKTLKFRINKTDDIIEKNDKEALERQRLSVTTISTMVNTHKESIEEMMFADGKSEDEIMKWSENSETLLAEADQCIQLISKRLKDMESEAQEHVYVQEQRKRLEFEKLLTDQKLHQEQEAAKEKMALEFEYQQKLKDLEPSAVAATGTTVQPSTSVKMPKLIITKFDGTPQDWVRFWGQFEAQIDKSSVDSVTKYSYLKELVEAKVRKLIDGLPFTKEGYDKAKDLLHKRYGQTSEVVGAYVRSILELPSIRERDVVKIHGFYETLLYNVESLQTLDSLGKLDAAVRFTFDKLEVIKSELAMTNENWSEWTFVQFVEALGKWTKNNPVTDNQSGKFRRERGRSFFANRDNLPAHRMKGCPYCSSDAHRATNCDKVEKPEERKKILAEKHLCFNCTGAKHRASECKSKSKCQVCQGKHHTSICDKVSKPREPGMTANHIGQSAVIHPVVVVRINGYKFRALLDSGASHSYASSTAIQLTNAKLKSTGLRQIAMLTGVTTRTMQVYEVKMHSLSGDVDLDVNITKIEKKELLSLENPRYKEIVQRFSHLKEVHMDDDDEKELLPVHLILGANDYAKIRTSESLRVGRSGEPVAEHTKFGWSIMSPGADQEVSLGCLAVNSTTDYDNLCSLDVLGLTDTTGQESNVLGEFKEQLTRSQEGWYETALPWKPNH